MSQVRCGGMDQAAPDALAAIQLGHKENRNPGEERARVPVLFMAELDRSESIRRGLIHPTAPYLRHPFPPSVLRRTIREALALAAARPIN